jgi:branched-chain amino acid transport system permease protein
MVTYLSRSSLGAQLRAIRDDPEAAAMMGVNVARARLKAWMLSTLVAALCGGLEAWYSNAIDADSAFSMLISTKSIIYGVLGGLGTVVGPVIGAVLMVSLDDLIWRHFPVLNSMLLGFVIIFLMLFAPRGVLGTLFQHYPAIRRYIS